jgi:hypothetical protein
MYGFSAQKKTKKMTYVWISFHVIYNLIIVKMSQSLSSKKKKKNVSKSLAFLIKEVMKIDPKVCSFAQLFFKTVLSSCGVYIL